MSDLKISDIRLPIDVVPGTDPPIFRWRQVVYSINGEPVVVGYREALPPHVEKSVATLIAMTKQLMTENLSLREKREQRTPPTKKGK